MAWFAIVCAMACSFSNLPSSSHFDLEIVERRTMEGEIDELVAKFCGVTTVNPEQAQFFLESTEWQLEPALQLFFDSEGGPQTRATAMSLEDYDLTEDESMGTSEPVKWTDQADYWDSEDFLKLW